MVCAAGRLQAQAQARRARRGTAASQWCEQCRRREEIPMLQGNSTRQDCHAVMEMELVPVGKYAPKRTDFSEKRTLQFYYHHMSMQSSSREATKQSLSRFKSDSSCCSTCKYSLPTRPRGRKRTHIGVARESRSCRDGSDKHCEDDLRTHVEERNFVADGE